MKEKISLTKLTCKRCGCEWFPKTEKVPKACPGCKQYKWQVATPVKMITKAKLSKMDKAKNVYEINKDWLDREDCFSRGNEGKFSDWFQSYKKYKGQHDFETFKKHIVMFLRIIIGAYTNDGFKTKKCEDSWKGRDEAFQCWLGYIGDEEEAYIYFYGGR